MMCYTGSGAVLVRVGRVAERAAVRAVESALDGVVPARLALDRAPIEHGSARFRAGRVAHAHVQALEVARVQVVRAFIPRRVVRKNVDGQLLDLLQIILLFIITFILRILLLIIQIFLFIISLVFLQIFFLILPFLFVQIFPLLFPDLLWYPSYHRMLFHELRVLVFLEHQLIVPKAYHILFKAPWIPQ